MIVEDELLVALDLRERLKLHGFEVVSIADNLEEAITEFKDHLPDIVLIDITIKGDKSGIDIANCINEIHPTPFIYISAHTDILTVNKAKNTMPASYLIKPFTTNSLLVSIELALHNFAVRNDDAEKDNPSTDEHFYLRNNHVYLKDGYRFVRIFLNDILFLSAEDNYVKVVTDKKAYLLRMTLMRANEILQRSYFVRIHRSYCINTNQISSYTENEVVIRDNVIPIGRNYKEALMRALKYNR